MDIGIVTSHTSFKNNYGAVLQCYALCEQLKRWEVSPHVINYVYSNAGMVVGMATRESHSLLARIKYILSSDVNFIRKLQYRLNRRKRMELEKRFVDFYHSFIPLTSSVGASYEDIEKNGFKFDGYITGSDQVWNPLIHGNTNDPCCFLQFSEPGKKRIAYAPSFGVSLIPEHCKESLAKYIESFDAVSVRERTGQKILKEVSGKDFPVVLDPTLMADPEVYKPISHEAQGLPDHYILCYRFGKMKYFDDIVKRASKKYHLPIIELPLSIESYGKGTKKEYSVGPAEFIGAIKGAELVLTDSFHCTVFSILNHVPFYTLLRQAKGEKGSMNSRMEELLSTFGLQNRLIASKDDVLKVDFSATIEYDGVDKILQEKRKESQEYLKNALEI